MVMPVTVGAMMKMASIRMCILDWMGNVCNVINAFGEYTLLIFVALKLS